MNLSSIIAAVSAPSGMWAGLINWVHSFVGGGYGWTILVLIILLKLVLSPLDYAIKHTSKQTSLMQQKLAPQLAKLNAKYGSDRTMIQQQTQALYKREGHNVFGSCIVMLVNLVLTFTIFITLFSSLRNLSSYQAIEQYDSLQTTYIESITTSYGSYESFEAVVARLNDETNPLTEEELQKYNQACALANQSAKDMWQNVKSNWLWVKNIWVTDGHASPFPSINDLNKMANSSKQDEYKQYVANISSDPTKLTIYNNISGTIVAEEGNWNGYYLLAILSIALSFLSQLINELSTKTKNKQTQQLANAGNPQANTMKFMKWIIPFTMAIFVLTTNAAFGIYVVTNSIMTTIIGYFSTLIINAVFKNKQQTVDDILQKEVDRLNKKALKGGK